MNNMSV